MSSSTADKSPSRRSRRPAPSWAELTLRRLAGLSADAEIDSWSPSTLIDHLLYTISQLRWGLNFRSAALDIISTSGGLVHSLPFGGIPPQIPHGDLFPFHRFLIDEGLHHRLCVLVAEKGNMANFTVDIPESWPALTGISRPLTQEEVTRSALWSLGVSPRHWAWTEDSNIDDASETDLSGPPGALIDPSPDRWSFAPLSTTEDAFLLHSALRLEVRFFDAFVVAKSQSGDVSVRSTGLVDGPIGPLNLSGQISAYREAVTLTAAASCNSIVETEMHRAEDLDCPCYFPPRRDIR